MRRKPLISTLAVSALVLLALNSASAAPEGYKKKCKTVYKTVYETKFETKYEEKVILKTYFIV